MCVKTLNDIHFKTDRVYLFVQNEAKPKKTRKHKTGKMKGPYKFTMGIKR